MTLNGVKALFCFISQNSLGLQAFYITVAEDRPILSAEYRLPLLGQKWPTLERGLSAIAGLLVSYVMNIAVIAHFSMCNVLFIFVTCYGTYRCSSDVQTAVWIFTATGRTIRLDLELLRGNSGSVSPVCHEFVGYSL